MCFAFPGAANTTSVPPSIKPGQKIIIGPTYNTFTKLLLEIAIERECDIILTGISSPEISDYLKYVNTVILNETESTDMCTTLGFQGPEHLVSQISGQKLLVTHGASGSTIWSAKQSAKIAAIKPERFKDPTGAGDAFSASVVFGMLSDFPLETCGLIGAAVASFVVEKFGGQTNLPTWKDIMQRLHEQISDEYVLPNQIMY